MYFEALEKKDCIEYLLDVLLYAPLSEHVQFIFSANEDGSRGGCRL